MGQYYKVVNISKKQTLEPHTFGDGMKLLEFGISGFGTMAALALLLSDGNGRGSGDFRSQDDEKWDFLVGSWAGDKIVITGDYADEGRFISDEKKNLYEESESYVDISPGVRELMKEDEFLNENMSEPLSEYNVDTLRSLRRKLVHEQLHHMAKEA